MFSNKTYILCLSIISVAMAITSTGCSEPSDSERDGDRYAIIAPTLNNPEAVLYTVHANDSMPGDSTRLRWSSGVLLSTQPGAEYTLDLAVPEEVELNLFEYDGNRVRRNPLIYSGACSRAECQISFTGREGGMQWWIAALSDSRLRGIAPDHFQLDGFRRGNNTLPIHVVFIGKLTTLPDSSDKAGFAERLIRQMEEIYASAKVTPVSSGLRTASRVSDTVVALFDPEAWEVIGENPRTGSLERHYLDLFAVPPDSGEAKGLTIAVVETIDREGYIGIAPLFGLNLGGGLSSVALIGIKTREQGGESTENSEEILFETIAHEVGHFLGLRHTTATAEDRRVMYDYSVAEDGLSDTPFSWECGWALGGVGGSYAVGTTRTATPFRYEARIRSGAAASDLRCPDVDNLMFPLAVDGVEQIELTPSQGKLMRAHLHLLQW